MIHVSGPDLEISSGERSMDEISGTSHRPVSLSEIRSDLAVAKRFDTGMQSIARIPGDLASWDDVRGQ